MRNYITIIALFFGLQLVAQGISVQGIARDNTNAAITNTDLPFTFNIVNGTNIIFAETQDIRTDNFGLFSHVVSTGTTTQGNFNSVDFSIQDLKLQVVVNYNGSNVTVYDQKLQYVPYAHYAKKATNAANGVPAGTVVAFMGGDNKIPDGWVKCAGQNISTGNEYANLRAVIGNTIPDMRGRYIKGHGQGTVPTGKILVNDNIGQTQNQSIAKHKHGVNINTDYKGGHSHYFYGAKNNTGSSLEDGGTFASYDENNVRSNYKSYTNSEGIHFHTVNGDTSDTGEDENRPWTVIVNWIIKL